MHVVMLCRGEQREFSCGRQFTFCFGEVWLCIVTDLSDLSTNDIWINKLLAVPHINTPRKEHDTLYLLCSVIIVVCRWGGFISLILLLNPSVAVTSTTAGNTPNHSALEYNMLF